MASIELTDLSQRLDEEEIAAILTALNENGIGPVTISDSANSMVVEGNLDSDMFVDFLDRLDANDANADIYLPVEFEDIVEVEDRRIGSAHSLLLVLESMREDFLVDDEEDDAEGDYTEAIDVEEDETDAEDGNELFGDETSALEMKDEQLRHMWKSMYRGAKHSVNEGLCLFVSG